MYSQTSRSFPFSVVALDHPLRWSKLRFSMKTSWANVMTMTLANNEAWTHCCTKFACSKSWKPNSDVVVEIKNVFLSVLKV